MSLPELLLAAKTTGEVSERVKVENLVFQLPSFKAWLCTRG